MSQFLVKILSVTKGRTTKTSLTRTEMCEQQTEDHRACGSDMAIRHLDKGKVLLSIHPWLSSFLLLLSLLLILLLFSLVSPFSSVFPLSFPHSLFSPSLFKTSLSSATPQSRHCPSFLESRVSSDAVTCRP